MPDNWCDFCEMPKAYCVHGNPEKVPQPPLVDGPTITASQTSPCGHCGDSMEPGDRITHTDEGWVHSRHVSNDQDDARPSVSADDFEGID